MIDLIAIAGLYALIAGQYTLIMRTHRELLRLKAETRICPYHKNVTLNGGA